MFVSLHWPNFIIKMKNSSLVLLMALLPFIFAQVERWDQMQHLIRPKEEVSETFETEPGILDGTLNSFNLTEENVQKNDDSSVFSIHRVSRKRMARKQQGTGGSMSGKRRGSNDDNVSVNGIVNYEALRQRLDTIILMMSRMGDRLVALETVQNQWKERTDNIQYRITKLELMGEERKSQLNDISGAVRHRLQTTDHELSRLQDTLSEIKTSIQIVDEKSGEMKSSFEAFAPQDTSKPKLQAVMATVFGVKNEVEKMSVELENTVNTISKIENATNYLGGISSSLVTKNYLQKTMADYNSRSSQMGMYTSPTRCATSNKPTKASDREPQDCWEIIKKRGKKNSGVYRIQPLTSPEPFFVYCDMETAGGGWTIIQRRHDGSVDFLREWTDYKHGFGNIAGEFWLGNEKIHQLTNHHVSELEIRLSDFDQQEGRAHYSAFSIGNEAEGYALKLLGNYMGDAGDSLLYHVGQRWSTIDSDSDAYPERNCARDHAGGWWYKACDTSNLNGRYLHGPVPMDHEYTGLYWYDFRGPSYSLWKSMMMVRRGGNVKEPVYDNKSSAKIAPTSSLEPKNTTQAQKDKFNPDEDPFITYEYRKEYDYDQMG